DRKEMFWRPFVICAFELLSSFVIRASSFIPRVPSGKFVFLPVDKTPHGREKIQSRFRRHWWRGFFGFALVRSVAGGRPSRYGDPLVHPQKEDYWGNVNPIGPRGVYDEAKRFAEAMTMAYYRYHKVDTKIVRIFNTYGPRMRLRDGRVVPAFIGQALAGKPLTVFGDGSQTRSFCYVSDLIDGIFKLAMSDFHEPVNIGNPREMTIKQFAEEIIR